MTDGAYLMDKIRARCVEEGDCLIWPGAFITRGPVATYKQKQYALRRVVWEERNGKPIPKGRMPSPNCGNPRCLEHVVAKTWSQLNSRPVSSAQKAKTAAAKRVGSKLSDEGVAAIRLWSGPVAEVAAMQGISKAYAYMIRRGQNRIDYSSPFAGLGARA